MLKNSLFILSFIMLLSSCTYYQTRTFYTANSAQSLGCFEHCLEANNKCLRKEQQNPHTCEIPSLTRHGNTIIQHELYPQYWNNSPFSNCLGAQLHTICINKECQDNLNRCAVKCNIHTEVQQSRLCLVGE
jgi:hypothetical protein